MIFLTSEVLKKENINLSIQIIIVIIFLMNYSME